MNLCQSNKQNIRKKSKVKYQIVAIHDKYQDPKQFLYAKLAFINID